MIQFRRDLFQIDDKLGERTAQAFGRFWTKDFLGSEWTGWLQNRGEDQDCLKTACETTSALKFDCVVNIGIGGSYLGTRAIIDFLENHSFASNKKYRKIFYAGHNTDSQYHEELFDEIASNFKPIFVVISKSGKTRETELATAEILKRFSHLQDLNERVIAVTELSDKSYLFNQAKKNNWKVFPVPNDVGGRYSCMTHVSLLPLALAGVKVEAIANGFYRQLSNLEHQDHKPLLSYVQFRLSEVARGKSIELLSYSNPKFCYLVEWMRQLYAESEAKQGKGVFPAGMAYSTDLHSIGQLVQQGQRNLFQTFLILSEKKRTDVFSLLTDKILKASKVAHESGGVSCCELLLDATQSLEHCLGEFLAFSMVACSVFCIASEVNPFDQPGVEVYKAEMR